MADVLTQLLDPMVSGPHESIDEFEKIVDIILKIIKWGKFGR